MAAQQPSYGTSYYQPHPHFSYQPAHAPYQYQYPIPPMNGHPHPPSSPRVNPHGRGYPPSRAGPSYQNYQHQHQHQSHHHYSYPQHSPHSPGPYPPSHQHGKYPVTYSPNYALHPSSPYHTAWQPQQPLSPLPKQLSMLPPLSPHHPDPPRDHTPTLDSDPVDISDHHTPEPPSSPPRVASASGSVPSSPSLSSASSTKPMTTNTFPEYVIWSRRPSNPSVAPGIIISPRARPPDDVIQKALVLPSPPPSPPPTEVIPDRTSTPTPDHIDAPSADTETTPATSSVPDTSIPVSPISSNTSLSATDSPAEIKSAELPQPDRIATPQPDIAAESVPAVPVEPLAPEPPATPAPAKPAGPKPSWASLLRKDAASPSKPNSLPTSSIVGFSIPASALSQSSTAPIVSPSKKIELQSLLSSGPSSQASMKIRPRGLVNTGNMCFANAVLQVLIYSQPFWRLFHELGKFLDIPADGHISNSKTPLVDATVGFLKEFVPKTKPTPEGKGKGVDRTSNGCDDDDDLMNSFIPTYVYDALKEKKRFDHMRGGHQEDAEEFLGFYLDTLEEELLHISSSLAPKTEAGQSQPETQNGHAAREDGPWLEVGKRNKTAVTRTAKSTESPITRMFGGKFRSTLRVPHQKDSIMFEDWRSLRLDIQREQIHTIKDALAYISSPQSVQVTSVTRPGATLDATQTVHIEALPPILILHLKRFLYDASAGGVAKIGKQVSFASELDVPTEVMAPGKKLYGTRYKLFGVLYHHGLSASGGHYTLDVLHPNIDNATGMGPTVKPREGWIRIDDELVSDVRPEDVFGPPEQDDRCAYLLFYRRVGMSGRN
ncbi:cysteine proteinase [Chiua virens]|nr:cysteine proteinase [Chiua virens]